jgi:uncharacterized protein involved in exopolysaccharide biosynthesis
VSVNPTPPEVRHPDDDDALGLGRLRDLVGFALGAPLRHRRLAAAAFVAVAALVVAAVLAIPHRYRVRASVLAQRTAMVGTLANPTLNRDWDASTRAAREVVVRREHLVALARDLNLRERYLAGRAPAVRARDWIVERLTGHPRDPDVLFEDLVDTLEDRLWIAASPQGEVTITFEWTDPVVAREVVQAALQTFLDERYATEIEAVGETIAVLKAHDARVQRSIDETLVEVESKQKALGIRPVPSLPRARSVAPDEDVAKLQAKLAARRRALADLESFREQRVAELQAQLTRERTIYAEAHPTLVATRHAVELLSQPSPQVTALRAETGELERQLQALGFATDEASLLQPGAETQLTEVRLRLLLTDDPRLAFERRRLEDLLRQRSNLVDRLDAAMLELDSAKAGFKYRYGVVAPARLPKRAAKPYGLLAVVGALLGGLSMALLAAVAADLHAGRVLARWQVESTLGLPVLGELGLTPPPAGGAPPPGAAARARGLSGRSG